MSTQRDSLPRYSALYTTDGEPMSPFEPRSPSHTKHDLHLTNKGKTWATLSVFSSASSPMRPPRFSTNDHVKGSLKLKLGSSENIQKISVGIRGRVITGANEGESSTFLDQAVPIWSKGDPEPFNGKHSGEYNWDIYFPFPADTKPPPSFRVRGVDATVQYFLILRVSRGRLRMDSKLQTPIIYDILTKPDPPSFLRRLAYQDNLSVPTPEGDPEGWLVLPHVDVHGALVQQKITLRCELGVAQPLSYTRGTVIPLNMHFQTLDANALTSLGAPAAVRVVLRRSVHYTLGNRPPLGTSERDIVAGRRVVKADVAQAVWRHRVGDQGRDHLEGEIHLPKDLPPSCEEDKFSVRYHIVLAPFSCPAFIPSTNERVLLEREVEVCTLLSDGPLALAFSPRPETSTLAPVHEDGSDNFMQFSPITGGNEPF